MRQLRWFLSWGQGWEAPTELSVPTMGLLMPTALFWLTEPSVLSPAPLCTSLPQSCSFLDPVTGSSQPPVVWGSSALPHHREAHLVLTFRGEPMVLPLLTAALTRRLPGMLMGSGATERLCSTTGSLLSPQFSQAKPPTCSTEGQEELQTGQALPCVCRSFIQSCTSEPAKLLLTKS